MVIYNFLNKKSINIYFYDEKTQHNIYSKRITIVSYWREQTQSLKKIEISMNYLITLKT